MIGANAKGKIQAENEAQIAKSQAGKSKKKADDAKQQLAQERKQPAQERQQPAQEKKKDLELEEQLKMKNSELKSKFTCRNDASTHLIKENYQSTHRPNVTSFVVDLWMRFRGAGLL